MATANISEYLEPSDRERVIKMANAVWPRIPDIVRGWTRTLPINVPAEQYEQAFAFVEGINRRLFDSLFSLLREGNLEGAALLYESFHQELIESQLALPDEQRINIDQFFESARMSIPFVESALRDAFADDPLEQSRVVLCFYRLWSWFAQSLGMV